MDPCVASLSGSCKRASRRRALFPCSRLAAGWSGWKTYAVARVPLFLMTTLARGTTVELMRTDATDSCRSTNARRLRWLRLLHQVPRGPLVRVPSERDEAHRWVTGIGRAAGDLAVVGVVVVAPEHELADELASRPTPPGWPSLRLLTGPAGRLHTITPANAIGCASVALRACFRGPARRRRPAPTVRRPPRGPGQTPGSGTSARPSACCARDDPSPR